MYDLDIVEIRYIESNPRYNEKVEHIQFIRYAKFFSGAFKVESMKSKSMLRSRENVSFPSNSGTLTNQYHFGCPFCLHYCKPRVLKVKE